MRIATWNVNGLRARLELVMHWLDEEQPTIAGLQELKLSDDQFPAEELAEAGYQAVWHGQKGWNGVAVLSREPCRLVEKGLPGQEEMGARLVTVETAGLSFTTVYVPNGKSLEHPDFERKLAWLDQLAAHLESTIDPAQPAVICGDINICPAAIDSWNEELLAGKLFHTDEERARITQLRNLGLVDLFREKNPDSRDLSWWDYRGGDFHRGHGLRIDLIFATTPLLDRVASVAIQRDWRKKRHGLTASDHAPVVADLD
jgi:exodeoxyribonuclease-3